MKRATTMILILILSLPLQAVEFGYEIFEIRTESEFASGVFPTSLMYQFNLPVPGDSTILGLRLDNGLEYRTLRQRPQDGAFYSKLLEEGGEAVDGFSYGQTREYTVLFDEFNIIFQQGAIHNDFTDRDLLSFRLSVDGRFENAFERLSWLTADDSAAGVFYTTPGNARFQDVTSWVGAPELKDNRSVFMISVTAGAEINYLRDKRTRRDGFTLSSTIRYNPAGFSFLGSTRNISFFLVDTKLDLAYTIFSVAQSGNSELTWVSLVLDNRSVYRVLYGNAVPAYVQGGKIWGLQLPNSEHVFTNKLSLTLYGPQMKSKDCFPAIKVFLDAGLSAGNALNTADEAIAVLEAASSWGVRASFVLFNILECYYEYGSVLDPVFNDAKTASSKFGISLGYSF